VAAVADMFIRFFDLMIWINEPHYVLR